MAGDLLDRTIVVALAPDELIPRGLPTPDLLAHVLVGKFADKLPFNRQQGISACEGVPITRGTMCGWAEAAHKSARLVVEAMVADAREHAHVIATDATGVLVQANDKCKRGHFWVYVADRDHVIFRYGPAQQGRAEGLLQGLSWDSAVRRIERVRRALRPAGQPRGSELLVARCAVPRSRLRRCRPSRRARPP
ncbi:transposase [Sorangium sp. So ce315]|uniref:IS66 family transposase n=1 Tax=Sorangium sp. So ce315 TaxID=3133299 RepID=UPI003F616D07